MKCNFTMFYLYWNKIEIALQPQDRCFAKKIFIGYCNMVSFMSNDNPFLRFAEKCSHSQMGLEQLQVLVEP